MWNNEGRTRLILMEDKKKKKKIVDTSVLGPNSLAEIEAVCEKIRNESMAETTEMKGPVESSEASSVWSKGNFLRNGVVKPKESAIYIKKPRRGEYKNDTSVNDHPYIIKPIDSNVLDKTQKAEFKSGSVSRLIVTPRRHSKSPSAFNPIDKDKAVENKGDQVQPSGSLRRPSIEIKYKQTLKSVLGGPTTLNTPKPKATSNRPNSSLSKGDTAQNPNLLSVGYRNNLSASAKSIKEFSSYQFHKHMFKYLKPQDRNPDSNPISPMETKLISPGIIQSLQERAEEARSNDKLNKYYRIADESIKRIDGIGRRYSQRVKEEERECKGQSEEWDKNNEDIFKWMKIPVNPSDNKFLKKMVRIRLLEILSDHEVAKILDQKLKDCEEKFAKEPFSKRKQILAEHQMRFDEYVDFSFQRNGYKDAIKYFNPKEGPPKQRKSKPKTPQPTSNHSTPHKTRLTIGGISLLDESNNKNNEKCQLNSRILSNLRFCAVYQR